MPYNFAAGSFHKNKLCSRLSSSEVRFLRVNGLPSFCVFEPPLGDMRETYDDHLRLIGKGVGEFLLVFIELFSLGIIRLRRYERLKVQNRRFCSKGGRLTQNLG